MPHRKRLKHRHEPGYLPAPWFYPLVECLSVPGFYRRYRELTLPARQMSCMSFATHQQILLNRHLQRSHLCRVPVSLRSSVDSLR